MIRLPIVIVSMLALVVVLFASVALLKSKLPDSGFTAEAEAQLRDATTTLDLRKVGTGWTRLYVVAPGGAKQYRPTRVADALSELTDPAPKGASLAFLQGSTLVETATVPSSLSVVCLARAAGFARGAARFKVRPAGGGGREAISRGGRGRCASR